MTVLFSGNDKLKMQFVNRDGFSNDLLEIISKLSPFGDSLQVTLVTLRKIVLKTLNSFAGREFCF